MGEWPFQIQATAWASTLLDVISTASCVLTNLCTQRCVMATACKAWQSGGAVRLMWGCKQPCQHVAWPHRSDQVHCSGASKPK